MTVEHHQDSRRFEVDTPHGTAYLSYELSPDGKVIDLQHTIVPQEAQGGGIGAALVDAAFAHAREQGLRVHPSCAYAKAWLARHPEHRSLAV